MKRAHLGLWVLVCACAGPDRPHLERGSYTLSLLLLDLQSAVLVRNREVFRARVDESFTMNGGAWSGDALHEAVVREIRRVRVLEAAFQPPIGSKVDLPLTRVEPDSELQKVGQRLPPYEDIEYDLRALEHLGWRRGTVSGLAEILRREGSVHRVRFHLEVRSDGQELRIRSLNYSPAE